ncbi:MAG: Rap1a/Tai family immunity protein [Alphaproteobacteria bacterium]
MRETLFAMVLTLGAMPALAQTLDTDDFEVATTSNLLDLCGAPAAHPMSDEGLMFCFGYLGGVMDFHRVLVQVEGDGFDPIACPNAPVSRAEMAQVFVDWAQANPQHMDEPAVDGLARAAVARWPC